MPGSRHLSGSPHEQVYAWRKQLALVHPVGAPGRRRRAVHPRHRRVGRVDQCPAAWREDRNRLQPAFVPTGHVDGVCERVPPSDVRWHPVGRHDNERSDPVPAHRNPLSSRNAKGAHRNDCSVVQWWRRYSPARCPAGCRRHRWQQRHCPSCVLSRARRRASRSQRAGGTVDKQGRVVSPYCPGGQPRGQRDHASHAGHIVQPVVNHTDHVANNK